jgi:hypothetical protein
VQPVVLAADRQSHLRADAGRDAGGDRLRSMIWATAAERAPASISPRSSTVPSPAVPLAPESAMSART